LASKANKQPNTLLRKQRELRGWSLQEVADQIARLCEAEQKGAAVNLYMVSRWEAGIHRPTPFYRTKLCQLYNLSAAELGFIASPQFEQHTSIQPGDSASETHKDIGDALPKQVHDAKTLELLSPTNYAFRSPLFSIPPASITAHENNLDLMRSYRQMLHDQLMLASTILILSPSMKWAARRAELSAPSVTEMAIDELEDITQSYWRLCKNTSLDLLGNLLEHFQTVIHLLRRPQPIEIALRLYSLAGECTQLLGKTLYDVQEYLLAWFYYAFSLKAAQAASNHELWATGLGRMSLLLMYWKRPQEALPFLQEARQLTIQSPRIRCWLAAIEAETHAHLGDAEACDIALANAKTLITNESIGEDRYATGFNPSRLAGYEGACFVRLRQSARALPALQQAVASLDPQAIRRRSTLFADIGLVHAQMGNIEQACQFAIEALAITTQTRSLSVLERVRLIRTELEPWEEDENIQTLEKHLQQTLLFITSEETLS
jgi:tetratricopeptide (TPR) repeat protein